MRGVGSRTAEDQRQDAGRNAAGKRTRAKRWGRRGQRGQPSADRRNAEQGRGIRATARAVGTGNETVHRIAREMRAGAAIG